MANVSKPKGGGGKPQGNQNEPKPPVIHQGRVYKRHEEFPTCEDEKTIKEVEEIINQDN